MKRFQQVRYETSLIIPAIGLPSPGVIGKVYFHDADRIRFEPSDGMLPAKSFVVWDRGNAMMQGEHGSYWTVDRLVLSESARDLVLHQLDIGCRLYVRNISSSHFIGMRAPAREDEDSLIAQLQDCFRYKDHTREDFARAINLLRPKHQVLDWPTTPARQSWDLSFYNPTDQPVAFSATIAGEYVTTFDID
jgi:hypothetical protein